MERIRDEERPARQDEAAAEFPMILVVDDDRDMRFVYSEWLKERYGVISLEDGEEFFETIETFEPSLVILDVAMPGRDGFALCRRLQARRQKRPIPVLFVTGRRSDEDFLKNLDAGGDAFLTKPVDRQALLSHIERLLGR